MTQEAVYKILKKKKKWMTSVELEKLMDVSKGSIVVCLNKLAQQDLVEVVDFNKDKINGWSSGAKPYFWRAK